MKIKIHVKKIGEMILIISNNRGYEVGHSFERGMDFTRYFEKIMRSFDARSQVHQ